MIKAELNNGKMVLECEGDKYLLQLEYIELGKTLFKEINKNLGELYASYMTLSDIFKGLGEKIEHEILKKPSEDKKELLNELINGLHSDFDDLLNNL